MGCWNHPNRSLVKAAQVIRSNANLIAISFNSLAKMLEAFSIIIRCLNHCCKQNSKRKHPNTWKTLIEGKPKWATSSFQHLESLYRIRDKSLKCGRLYI